jgi:hypothetical protein
LRQSLKRPFPLEARRGLLLMRFKVLALQVRLAVPGARDELEEFALQAATSDDAEVADAARYRLLSGTLEATADTPRLDALTARRLADLLVLHLRGANPDPSLLCAATMKLEASEEPELAATIYREWGAKAEEQFGDQTRAAVFRRAAERMESPDRSYRLGGPELGGSQVTWEQLSERRLIVVDFFAVASEVYRSETADLKRLYKRYAPLGLEIVTVSLDRDKTSVQSWVADEQVPWKVIYEAPAGTRELPGQRLFDLLALAFPPSRVVLDSEGHIVAYHLQGQALSRFVRRRLVSVGDEPGDVAPAENPPAAVESPSATANSSSAETPGPSDRRDADP